MRYGWKPEEQLSYADRVDEAERIQETLQLAMDSSYGGAAQWLELGCACVALAKTFEDLAAWAHAPDVLVRRCQTKSKLVAQMSRRAFRRWKKLRGKSNERV